MGARSSQGGSTALDNSELHSVGAGVLKHAGQLTGWLTAIFAALLYGNAVDEVAGTVSLGVIGLAHSAIHFVRSGSNVISASAVFAFGAGLFLFFPAIYSAFDPPEASAQYLLLAAFVCAVSQMVIYHAAIPTFSKGPRARRVAVTDGSLTVVAAWLFLANLALYAGAIAGLSLPVVERPLAYILLVLFALCASRSTISTSLGLVGCGALFLLYSEFMFDGFGRLVLGSLGLAVASCYSYRWRDSRVKLGIILISAPLLSFMIAWRKQFTIENQGTENAEGSGIGSILAPFNRLAQLLEMSVNGELDLVWFDTFFASAVVWIPRSIWPTKPVGFGAELAKIFNPHLVEAGHSDAASAYGEFLFSFGLAGLIVAPLVIGFVLARSDDFLERAELSAQPVVLIALMLVLFSSIVDYAWNGTFTYVARVGLRVAVLLILLPLTRNLRLPAVLRLVKASSKGRK